MTDMARRLDEAGEAAPDAGEIRMHLAPFGYLGAVRDGAGVHVGALFGGRGAGASPVEGALRAFARLHPGAATLLPQDLRAAGASAAGPMPQPPTARECLAIINCSVHGRQIDYFLCPKCAAVQPTAATDDARDAARYRWLRDHSSGCDLGDAFDKTARVRIGRELFYAQTLDDALDKLRALDNTPDRPLCGYCHGFGTVPHYTYALQLDNGVTPGQTVMRTCPTCKGTGRG